MNKYMWLLIIGLCLTPVAAHAIVFSDNEVVELTEPVDDDVFFAGERVTIDQPIADDAYLAGSIVEVTNTIGEDLMAAGNSVTVSSAIGDDAFLAGDRVVIEGATRVGDLFAAGRMVEVREGAEVSGDAYLAGANLVLHGSFGGDVRVAGESVTVAADTTIAGDLIVHSPSAPTVTEGATIEGSVRHTPTKTQERDGARVLISRWVRNVITWFIVGLLLLYLAPRLTAAVLQRVYTGSLLSFGIGLLWLVACVPVTLLLLFTVIGWPIALAILTLSALLILLSLGFLPVVVGTWLHRRFVSANQEAPLQWQHALLGSAVIVTLQFVPVIGPLVSFVLWTIILGTLLQLAKRAV